ncbi:nucleotidyltransferase [Clostridium sp. DMHC 10]|uniref:nucleotidyltransferase domain-containing protein n=1 Tax=Clostridium sp. DMHC 10 TaxID=747377 RepID=UPI00069F729A|nr:nucleotidyltransferase domain-containing protein [Clostridium sp. DMHC 10]KOF55940.1 nucleotidyltransferase [Clostridium sp. DMHC 10]
MEKTILQYQKAYLSTIDKLKSNKSVLAVMVFGSMISGDLWDGSDIDFFVIVDEELKVIKNIYTEENDISVHIKLIGKSKFLMLNESDLKGGFFHRIFASSKLVFSKDMEITARYDSGRYYPDIDRKKWNVVYLGKAIKSMDNCKKSLISGSIYTAYCEVFKCIGEFSKLYVNYSGYMINNDAVSMLTNADEKFKKCIDALLFEKENIEEAIKGTINYIETMINSNIKEISDILIDYMRKKDCFLSEEDINSDPLFKGFDINSEEILNKLWELNIIKKKSREYKLKSNVCLINENVYYI